MSPVLARSAAVLLGLLLTLSTVGQPAAAARTALPDSVLARIDGRWDVTVRRLELAARVARIDPDSLTPQQRREFLDLLIDQRVLARRAARAGLAWSPRDSAEWLSLRDHLILSAVLDSALVETARRRSLAGQTELPPEELGSAARDSAMAWLQPRYVPARVKSFAQAFAALPRRSAEMSIMDQIRVSGLSPHVAPEDSLGVLAESRIGDYRGAQLLTAWAKLNPIQRPRIETEDHVRQLIENGLFERLLRDRAANQGIERSPSILAVLAERRELIECTALVQREVYDGLRADSVTLWRYFRASERHWDLPAAARVVLLTFATRADAETWRIRLAYPAQAETLIVRDARVGGRMVGLVTAESDSAFHARLMHLGVGVVVGPDSLASGWRVAKVLELHPARPRTFDEARALVQKAWLDEEGERRMRRYLDRLRRAARIVVNERALSVR